MGALEERAAGQGRPPPVLMEEAGLAVAQEVWVNLGAVPERKVVVLVGPGNNGGDGLVAARHLQDWEANVVVYMLAARGEDDANLEQLVERGVTTAIASDDDGLKKLDDALAGADCIIDALLGTGRARPIEGLLASVLDRVSATRDAAHRPPVIAVDLPTGVDCDTGAADPRALRADATVALGCSKFGLHTLPGADYAGRVEVVDIGLPAAAVDALPVELLNARWVRERLPERPANANKGSFGRVLVVAGSKLYVGAARLAALGALRSGAGLVTVACSASVQPLIAGGLTEATYLPLPDADGFVAASAAVEVARASGAYDVLLLGPGLGPGPGPEAFVRQLLCSLPDDVNVVVDADGLNALAKLPHWWERIAARCVLTPHPGEHARLTRSTVDAVQGDRLTSARDAASLWGKTVVLKSAHTVIAAADGNNAAVNPYANPALASAGTGDVLAGAIAGLVAQGLAPFDAAACGSYLHAAAAEGLRGDLGDAGLLAGDLLLELPRTLRALRTV
jgi:NAD(P)H-hydrate epimerase